MMNVTDSIDIPAPPEQTVQKIASPETWEDWLVIHAGFSDGVPETFAPGTTFKERVKILGMPGEVKWTITDVELGESGVVAMDGEGPMGTTMTARFEVHPADDGGTHVQYEASYGGAALTPLMGQLEKATKEASAESLQKLRDLVSSQA
jgi:carbon monoxide dehydrogenase subunit G